MAHLRLHVDDDVATLTLANLPQNRIGREMVDDLARAVQQIGASGARAVLVTAEGPDFAFQH